MSCLIIKNDGIGDLILSSGLIASLGEYFDGRVDLVTCSANREIAEGIEPLRERYYVSRDDLRFSRRLMKHDLLLSRVSGQDQQVIKRLGQQKYDVAICLRRFIRQNSLVIMRKIKSKKKFCAWQFPTNISRDLALKACRGWTHYDGAVSVFSELVYYANFIAETLGAYLDISPRLRFGVKAVAGHKTGRLALGLSGSSSTWPEEYWIELVDLLNGAERRIILLGGPDVKGLADRIEGLHPSVLNLVGQLGWHATSESLQKCDAYIGNDTGLSHFASLIVRKCLIILGGGTFRRFFPWPDNDNQYLVYYGLDCFDCNWQCKFEHRKCVTLVTPIDVFSTILEILNGSKVKEYDLDPHDVKYPISWRRRPVNMNAFVRGGIVAS